MSGVDIAGLVEELRAAAHNVYTPDNVVLKLERAADALLAQAAELAGARAKSETEITEARHTVLSLLYMPGVRAALDNLPEDDPIEPYLEMARKGDEALAALKVARNAALDEALAAIDALKGFVPVQGDRSRFNIYDLTRAFKAGISMAREDVAALTAAPQGGLPGLADATNNPPSDPGTKQREAGL